MPLPYFLRVPAAFHSFSLPSGGASYATAIFGCRVLGRKISVGEHHTPRRFLAVVYWEGKISQNIPRHPPFSDSHVLGDALRSSADLRLDGFLAHR
jgi:hypothetical protein